MDNPVSNRPKIRRRIPIHLRLALTALLTFGSQLGPDAAQDNKIVASGDAATIAISAPAPGAHIGVGLAIAADMNDYGIGAMGAAGGIGGAVIGAKIAKTATTVLLFVGAPVGLLVLGAA